VNELRSNMPAQCRNTPEITWGIQSGRSRIKITDRVSTFFFKTTYFCVTTSPIVIRFWLDM